MGRNVLIVAILLALAGSVYFVVDRMFWLTCTIVNEFGQDVKDVSVTYPGGTVSIPLLRNGSSVRSAVTLKQVGIGNWAGSVTDLNGAIHSQPFDTYIETGYKGKVIVRIKPGRSMTFENHTYVKLSAIKSEAAWLETPCYSSSFLVSANVSGKSLYSGNAAGSIPVFLSISYRPRCNTLSSSKSAANSLFLHS